MKCPTCESCEYAQYCGATEIMRKCERHNAKVDMTTNEEWLRSATFEEMAGAIYEWHTKGYTKGWLETELNPITEVVDWLKQPHTTKE